MNVGCLHLQKWWGNELKLDIIGGKWCLSFYDWQYISPAVVRRLHFIIWMNVGYIFSMVETVMHIFLLLWSMHTFSMVIIHLLLLQLAHIFYYLNYCYYMYSSVQRTFVIDLLSTSL